MPALVLAAALAASSPAPTAAPTVSPSTPGAEASPERPGGAGSAVMPSGAGAGSAATSSGAGVGTAGMPSGAGSAATSSGAGVGTAATPQGTAGASGRRVPADGVDTGTLELRATRAEGGQVVVRDPAQEAIATLRLRPGERVVLDLPPGSYAIDDAARGGRVTLSVEAGKPARFVLTPEGARGQAGEPPPAPAPVPGPHGRRPWKRVVSPLLSAVVPGLGQMVNGEPAKGLGFFLGTVALGLGSALLADAGRGTDVSTKGLGGSSFGTEVVGGVGYGLMSGALHMLYAAQVMDAYASAAGLRTPQPRVRHRVALEVGRSATVGIRAGDPAAAFYPDWSVTVMGQVARRLSVGASDLSFKQDRGISRTTLQGGVRVHYRFFDRGRVWLGAAAGLILQGSFGRAGGVQVDPDEPPAGSEGSFAAIPYAQGDLRFFILNRWSLNLTPRISAPLAGPRFFNGAGDRAIPRHAVTLELGTGIGVYF